MLTHFTGNLQQGKRLAFVIALGAQVTIAMFKLLLQPAYDMAHILTAFLQLVQLVEH